MFISGKRSIVTYYCELEKGRSVKPPPPPPPICHWVGLEHPYLAWTERNSGPPSIRCPSLRMRPSSYSSCVQKWLPLAAVASSTPEKPKGSFDSVFKLNILLLTLSLTLRHFGIDRKEGCVSDKNNGRSRAFSWLRRSRCYSSSP